MRRRAWASVLAVALTTGAGCSSDDRPASDAGARAETDAAGSSTPGTDLAPTDGATTVVVDGFVRATVEGVTFRYPDRLFAGVEPLPPTDESKVTVVLAARDPDLDDAIVAVRTVRDRSGAFLGTVTNDTRDLIGQLEARPSDGVRIEFVNGGGVRRAGDGRYVFDGLARDGTQLVSVVAPVPRGINDESELGDLDAWVGSIFVDASALALEDECQDGVEVLTEVQLAPTGAIAPGEVMTARWTTLNAGTCAWTAADGWVFAGGDAVTLIDVGSVAGVEPGDDHEVVMSFVAPADPGQYALQMQFLPGGQLEPIGPIQAISVDVAAT